METEEEKKKREYQEGLNESIQKMNEQVRWDRMDDDKTEPVRRDGINLECYSDDSKHCSLEDWEAIYDLAKEEYKTSKKRFVDEFFPSRDLNTICDLNNGFDRLTKEQK